MRQRGQTGDAIKAHLRRLSGFRVAGCGIVTRADNMTPTSRCVCAAQIASIEFKAIKQLETVPKSACQGGLRRPERFERLPPLRACPSPDKDELIARIARAGQ
jgi:hypothetical protein